MSCWITVWSLVLFLGTTNCLIQISSRSLRVVRSTNSSNSSHHEWEYSEMPERPPGTNGYVNISQYENQKNESTKSSHHGNSAVCVPLGNKPSAVDESYFSDAFLSCSHINMSHGSYEILPNRSVYTPLYKRLFNTTDYYIDEEHCELYICSDVLNVADDVTKFSDTLAIVSIVGTVISNICIILHMAMFLSFKKLRNLPGYSLFSMCIALLIAYICTYISHFREEESDCAATGLIKAYSFLACFFWMNTMSYDIWRSLRMATSKLRLTGDRPMMTRFAMYSAYSWGVPLFIIVVGLIVDSSPNSLEKYRPKMANDTCWFFYKQALLVYFAVPLFTLLFFNIVLFIACFCMIQNASMNTAENKADLWPRFLVCIRLGVVMGLMWIFGVLATATEASWLWYFSVICNVLQGVFIFFSFTFTEKTRKECIKAIQKKKSSVFPTQTTSQQSTSV